MTTARTRGRPRRGGGEPGKDKIVFAAREMLRMRPQIELHRKELAIKAGVTRALVSYYFPDQPSLVEAVAKPVFQAYLAQLKETLQASSSVEDRFLALVTLFLKISRDDGQLVDSYVAYVKRYRRSAPVDFLLEVGVELQRFFKECEDQGYIRPIGTGVVPTIVWGTCKIIAQTGELKELLFNGASGDTAVEHQQAAMIVDLLMRGLGPQAAPPAG